MGLIIKLGVAAFLIWFGSQHLGVMDKLAGIVKESVCKLEANKLHEAMRHFYSINQRFPESQEEFEEAIRTAFVAKEGGKDFAKDTWGIPYQYEPLENGYQITSAGRDKEFGTSDDIVLKVSTQ